LGTILFSFNKRNTFVQQYLYAYEMNVKVNMIIRTPQYSSLESTSSVYTVCTNTLLFLQASKSVILDTLFFTDFGLCWCQWEPHVRTKHICVFWTPYAVPVVLYEVGSELLLDVGIFFAL